jgi:hypothetical protein
MFSQSFQPVLRIHIFGVDPDPDPRIDASDWWIRIRIFITDLQDANKKIIVLKKFFCLLFFEATFASFFKDNSRDKGFSYNFCLMIKGSGSRRSQKYGSHGSGSAKLICHFCKLSHFRYNATYAMVLPRLASVHFASYLGWGFSAKQGTIFIPSASLRTRKARLFSGLL